MASVAQPSTATAVLCPLLGTPRSGRLRRLPETPVQSPGTHTGSGPHRLTWRLARASPDHATLGTAALKVNLWMSFDGAKQQSTCRHPQAHQGWQVGVRQMLASPHRSQNVHFQGVRRIKPNG